MCIVQQPVTNNEWNKVQRSVEYDRNNPSDTTTDQKEKEEWPQTEVVTRIT